MTEGVLSSVNLYKQCSEDLLLDPGLQMQYLNT